MTRQEIYKATRNAIKLFEPDSITYRALTGLLEIAISDNHRVRSQITMIERLHKEMDEKKYIWKDFSTFEAESHHGEMALIKWINPEKICTYDYAVARFNCAKNTWVFNKDMPQDVEKQWINLPPR